MFITSFLKSLWNAPEAMYHIIKNSEPEVVQSYLSPFIVNNFYCNYLSGNYMENNLLYVITLMLKDEIDNLENISQIDEFLDNTKCGFLLQELIKMPDVQIVFRNIIFKTIEKMERTCSFRIINFRITEILNEFKKIKEVEDKKASKKVDDNLDEIYKEVIDSKILDPSINYSKKENQQYTSKNNKIFMEKYVAGINIDAFETNTEKAKKQNKNNLVEYFDRLKNDIKLNNNPELYSNTELMNHMLETKLPTYMLLFYQNDFLQIISFINQLIQDLIDDILLLPKSVKYICKIISLLIQKKFKGIKKEDENAFISKFILGKLLIPIIKSPAKNSLINDFVISGNTLTNINLMCYIIEKLFSGKLFLNNAYEADYTPFNWLFMDKIEIVFDFFEKATNVNLPNFIENYINEQLPSDYSYDFFNENKEELCANISIGFTIENLFHLIQGLKKSEKLLKEDCPKIKRLKKAFSRLSLKRTMDEIKEVDNKAKVIYIDSTKNSKNNSETEIENIYLYNDFEIEKKYGNLFSINNKIANFYINLKNIEKTKSLSEEEKNIIKIKNYLCSVLGNFRLLNKSDFNIESSSNTIKMLNEIKIYMSLPNYILDNNTIPSVWYINSILDYLEKIPNDYIEKDYQKLFNELTNNLNDSINNLDFEKLILFRNKVKFIGKIYDYFENKNQLIKTIEINEKIKDIAEKAFIPIDISFNYFEQIEEKKQFELSRSSIKEKAFEDNVIYEDSKKKYKSFKTIEAFTRYFPNLARYQYHNDINPIEIMKDLKVNEKLNEYYKIIKDKIIKKKLIENQKYEELYREKIIDYIMDKIYNKIYPLEPDYRDIQIFKKTNELSWVEFQSLINKDYIFDNMLPEILNEFNKINISKTPYKKLNSIRKIMEYIENLIKFNEGMDKEIGAEDITPVLNYIFIKAQPSRINTDIEYIKLFLENSGEYENALINFQSMCDVIINTDANSFNLTKEEYYQKCLISINGLS